MTKQKIALVLASGGARGIAHIGAIEELERQGFEIASVAGTSMGALVGGMYVSGNLQMYKEWMLELNRQKILSLMDFTLSSEGLVRGDKVINALKKIIPDVLIENLPLPYTAIATDIIAGKEIILKEGSLYNAIRASISIPSLLQPVKQNGMILIDGGIVNPLPLNRVQRSSEDLLVAIDVSASSQVRTPIIKKRTKKTKGGLINRLVNMALAPNDIENDSSFNYYTLLTESSNIMINRISQLTTEIYHPDILIQIPNKSYGILEFYKSAEIIELGVETTKEAIRKYKARKQL